MSLRMTHILLIASELMDMHTSRLAGMLLEAGYAVTLVARENPFSRARERFAFYKYPAWKLPSWLRPYRLREFFKDWLPAQRLRFIWRKARPDVVHHIYIGDGAYRCALAGLSPLVLTALGSDINDVYENGSPNQKSRIVRTLQAASHVTADTAEVLDRCEALAGKPLNKRLFYFGIELSLFRPRSDQEKLSLRKRLGLPMEARILLSPRRITEKMRQDVVLRAFKQVLDAVNLNLILILRRFGSFSISLESELKKLADDLGIGDRVLWLDKLDYGELPILYSLADAVVNVPEQDGLPVTLFEASACQTPIVTSDLPSYQEFLSDGACFRVDVGDADAVAKSLMTILEKGHSGLANQLRTNYELVLQMADQRKCLAIMEEIYSLASHSTARFISPEVAT